MREAVSEILDERAQVAAGLSRMVVLSLLAHGVLLSTLIFTPSHSMGAIESDTEMFLRCSSGSWSETVLPSSTVPIRVIAPDV